MRKILPSVSVAAVLVSSLASANEKVIQLSNSDENWVMPGKDYSSDNYSKMTQIDASYG